LRFDTRLRAYAGLLLSLPIDIAERPQRFRHGILFSRLKHTNHSLRSQGDRADSGDRIAQAAIVGYRVRLLKTSDGVSAITPAHSSTFITHRDKQGLQASPEHPYSIGYTLVRNTANPTPRRQAATTPRQRFSAIFTLDMSWNQRRCTSQAKSAIAHIGRHSRAFSQSRQRRRISTAALVYSNGNPRAFLYFCRKASSPTRLGATILAIQT